MEHREIVIIGAGTAGLSAGLYAARAGMQPLILDDLGGGGQVLEIDNLENYPGIFPAVNGAELIDAMTRQAESFGAKIVQSKVKSIDRKGETFVIETSGGSIEADALVYATGAEHTKLGVPGENEFEGRGVSYCAICDGRFFKDRKMVVVGGGDSACSEALYLSNLASHIDLVHRRNELRAAKTLADRILSNEKISVHFDTVLKEIKGENTVSGVVLENVKTGEKTELSTDAVFIFVGMKPRADLLENLPKDKAGYIVTDEKMATAVPGLYIAGDVRSKPLRQIVTAASDGAVAAVMAAEYVKEKNG